MKFKDEKSGDVVLFELKGKIMGGDGTTEFRGRIHEYLDLQIRKFVVDLAQVEWLNSEGIGMLIRTHKAIKDAGGRLALSSIEGKSEQLMALTRLATQFEHFDSKESAIRSLEN